MGDLKNQLERIKAALSMKKSVEVRVAPANVLPVGKRDVDADASDPEQDWKYGVEPLHSSLKGFTRVSLIPASKRLIRANVAFEKSAAPQPSNIAPKAAERTPPRASITRENSFVFDRTTVVRNQPQTPSQPPPIKDGQKTVVTSPQPVRAEQGKANRSFALPAGATLARSEHFGTPEPWVQAGSNLQVQVGGLGATLPVRIGIDFGTAYTKVAIRVAANVFFLRWSGLGIGSDSLYLPGELSEFEEGSVFPGRATAASKVWTDLKLPFLPRAPKGGHGRAATVAFLAWVMRYARAWLYREQPALVRGRRLAWEVNIGCPTNVWDDKAMINLYRHIGLSAWKLSQFAGLLSLAEGAAALEQTQLDAAASIGLDGLHPIPEFVAQIAGYAQSPQRQMGLHLLVDCGAGTLDAVTFNVHRQSGEDYDRYPIFASAVEPFGTHFLMEARIKRAECFGTWNDFDRIPEAREFAAAIGVDSSRIVAADERFGANVRTIVAQILGHTRRRRTPLALAWEQGLPVFLTGGGSHCDLYAMAVESACRHMRVDVRQTPFPLAEEARQNRIASSEFHRLSVAFGLTYDAHMIGKIVPAAEIDDFIPEPRHVVRPDRDELYPK